MYKATINPYNDYLSSEEIAKLKNIFEDNYKTIVQALKIKRQYPEIKYFLYPSAEIKEKVTGEDANAHTDNDKFEVYLVYNDIVQPTGPHELVHLLTSHINIPNYVFSEGLAEYFEDYWKAKINGRMEELEHDKWVKRFIEDNTYISISDLFDDSKFWSLDEGAMISYPESGSFLKYLVRKYGLDKVMSAYEKLTRNNPDNYYNRQVFKEVFDISIGDAEREWLKYLNI